MTPEHFQTLLDRRGTAIGTWPWRDRRAARRLLAQSADARDRLAEGEALDRALGGAGVAPVGPTLHARLTAIPGHHPPSVRPIAEPRPLWWAGATLATASLLTGLVLGTTLFAPTEDVVDIAGLAYGDTYLTELSQ
ncbi:hypothetical protein [Spectribacter hydrogenoxidans]|uniref:Uncharacterized protein n=1 Tax=Spectribacter hydrogenoxidans TaxID=3075608 RepID=A0ABU3C3R8_9GAMM|nr:hypothetical protein [Salinisphaera sp. W335]MDT0636212.1 hypothetical protein [Salinisphaera sp. W335]